MANLFKWRKFNKEIIILCVKRYLKYPLSYRNVVELAVDRGLSIDHSTVYRWVQRYAPILDLEARKHLKKTGGSYRVDETYVKVKGKWKYLYRAVDKNNQTIDFYLSFRRDKGAAKKFFRKVLKNQHTEEPYVINVDKNKAYPPAIKDLKNDKILPGNCKIRQVKYLNNGIEQDHRFIKKLCKTKQWFRKFSSAKNTIAGYEIMNMIRKGQVKNVAKGNIIAQNNFITSLFEMVA